ncbi:PREDICTED: uncharacterized protein LOC106147295 [Chinchilla lanigera]|uniref:uncharacterized protein LOC106147295 n=1 Tax=Chinchilla lanigera TaxID=34839 RepID=UPI0006975E9C|nr:PREDICTED: uncharacterized protein LOC106147295 [Chinchilla lanigera]
MELCWLPHPLPTAQRRPARAAWERGDSQRARHTDRAPTPRTVAKFLKRKKKEKENIKKRKKKGEKCLDQWRIYAKTHMICNVSMRICIRYHHPSWHRGRLRLRLRTKLQKKEIHKSGVGVCTYNLNPLGAEQEDHTYETSLGKQFLPCRLEQRFTPKGAIDLPSPQVWEVLWLLWMCGSDILRHVSLSTSSGIGSFCLLPPGICCHAMRSLDFRRGDIKKAEMQEAGAQAHRGSDINLQLSEAP